ncbi:hypothetical protein D1872_262850 [compost metagenome]
MYFQAVHVENRDCILPGEVVEKDRSQNLQHVAIYLAPSLFWTCLAVAAISLAVAATFSLNRDCFALLCFLSPPL